MSKASRKIIYKYEINPSLSEQIIHLPQDYKIISVIEQFGKIQMYAIVCIDTPIKPVTIYVNPTGMQVQDNIFNDFEFIGTVQLLNGAYIAHIFKDKI